MKIIVAVMVGVLVGSQAMAQTYRTVVPEVKVVDLPAGGKAVEVAIPGVSVPARLSPAGAARRIEVLDVAIARMQAHLAELLRQKAELEAAVKAVEAAKMPAPERK